MIECNKDSYLALKAHKAALAAELRRYRISGNQKPYAKQLGYRKLHIAHCLLRGTPREAIEGNYRDKHNLWHAFVNKKADEIVEQVISGEYK